VVGSKASLRQHVWKRARRAQAWPCVPRIAEPMVRVKRAARCLSEGSAARRTQGGYGVEGPSRPVSTGVPARMAPAGKASVQRMAHDEGKSVIRSMSACSGRAGAGLTTLEAICLLLLLEAERLWQHSKAGGSPPSSGSRSCSPQAGEEVCLQLFGPTDCGASQFEGLLAKPGLPNHLLR